MGSKIALIFGSVPCECWDFLKPLQGKCTVICADGGLHCARSAGFQPDFYIGDSDSGGHPEPGLAAILLKPEKDLTDLQAAYEYARDHDFREIVLTACTGGRQDHHLANCQLLEKANREGVHAVILDSCNEISYLEDGAIELDCRDFRYFSLIPLDRKLHGVRITGAKYPLDVPELLRGSSLTVSNEAPSGTAHIEIQKGAAWIILSERL